MGSAIGHIISLIEEKQLTKNIRELNSVENLWLLQSEIPESGSRKKCSGKKWRYKVWPSTISLASCISMARKYIFFKVEGSLESSKLTSSLCQVEKVKVLGGYMARWVLSVCCLKERMKARNFSILPNVHKFKINVSLGVLNRCLTPSVCCFLVVYLGLEVIPKGTVFIKIMTKIYDIQITIFKLI